MISAKYLDRGYKDSIVLVPGWACDHRVFARLDIKFNYLIPENSSPSNFAECLLKALSENNIKRISLFGHSLGAFVASEFASQYPGLVDELILVSARKKYGARGLEEIKTLLRRNKEAYLYKFYSECFPEKSRVRDLLKSYRGEMSLDHLLKTLDYFKDAEIRPEFLNKVKRITIVHGERDTIAPLNEALDIKDSLPHSRFILIKGAGHMPFLQEDFESSLWPPRR